MKLKAGSNSETFGVHSLTYLTNAGIFSAMGSGKERAPRIKLLQTMVDELEAQQKLSVNVSQIITEQFMQNGSIDLSSLLLAHGRMVQSQTDLIWIVAMLKRGDRTRDIIKITKRKDELNRTANGAHENTASESINPDEPSNA